MTISKSLLRHLAQNQLQGQIDGGASIRGIFHNYPTIAGNCTQDAEGTIFSVGDFPKHCLRRWADEEGIVLLIFGSPNFENGEGIVTHVNLDAPDQNMDVRY